MRNYILRAARLIGRGLLEVLAGLGLIARDIHRALYRRYRARLWWYYGGAGFGAYLWATGQFWNFIFSLLTLAIVFFGLWLMVIAPFRRGRRRER